jgi:hypothetical protein
MLAITVGHHAIKDRVQSIFKVCFKRAEKERKIF